MTTLPNIRVLLVEDDEDLAQLLAGQLGRLGFEVTIAYSVAQARVTGGSGVFDVLVTDGQLLDGNADAVAESVRARARVLLAGTDGTGRPGFDRVLLKPAPAQELASAIRACLDATV